MLGTNAWTPYAAASTLPETCVSFDSGNVNDASRNATVVQLRLLVSVIRNRDPALHLSSKPEAKSPLVPLTDRPSKSHDYTCESYAAIM